MRQWEYFSGPIDCDNDVVLVGKDGWELVSVVLIPTFMGHDGQGDQIFEHIPHGYFKRPMGVDKMAERILAIANRVGA